MVGEPVEMKIPPPMKVISPRAACVFQGLSMGAGTGSKLSKNEKKERKRKRNMSTGMPVACQKTEFYKVTYKVIKTIKFVEWTASGYHDSSPDRVLEAHPVHRAELCLYTCI